MGASLIQALVSLAGWGGRSETQARRTAGRGEMEGCRFTPEIAGKHRAGGEVWAHSPPGSGRSQPAPPPLPTWLWPRDTTLRLLASRTEENTFLLS